MKKIKEYLETERTHLQLLPFVLGLIFLPITIIGLILNYLLG